jgi:3D (Asp-Asp-Asp) domain-containing protein
MIRLKILAALFSMAVAVKEEFNILGYSPDEANLQNKQLVDTTDKAPPLEPVKRAIDTPTTYTVAASVYFPEPHQTDSTPFITADGSKINKKNPKKHRWIAVSRDLHSRWGGDIEFGDSLMVSGVSEELDGIYIVRDVMNRRMHHKIDILVGRKDKIMGLWHDVQLARLD